MSGKLLPDDARGLADATMLAKHVLHRDCSGTLSRDHETVCPVCPLVTVLLEYGDRVARTCAELVQDEPDDIDWTHGVEENVQKFRQEIATAILTRRGLM